MRRWIATPFYGAMFAPVYVLLTELGTWLLAGAAAGAALGFALRRRR